MLQARLLDNKPSEWLAHRFYVPGQFDMCLSVVEQILRKVPENAEALSLKGSVLRTKGQIEEALGCFQTAYDVDSENIRHPLEIAKCLFFLGRCQQSLKILQDVEQAGHGNAWEVSHLLGQSLGRCGRRIRRLRTLRARWTRTIVWRPLWS
jgi:predicted Zn-dependent protease